MRRGLASGGALCGLGSDGMLTRRGVGQEIVAAVSGASASAAAAEVTEPRVASGSRAIWVALARLSGVAAVLNAAAYLDQSPLPGDGAKGV
jgi:hypothetical protein